MLLVYVLIIPSGCFEDLAPTCFAISCLEKEAPDRACQLQHLMLIKLRLTMLIKIRHNIYADPTQRFQCGSVKLARFHLYHLLHFQLWCFTQFYMCIILLTTNRSFFSSGPAYSFASLPLLFRFGLLGSLYTWNPQA